MGMGITGADPPSLSRFIETYNYKIENNLTIEYFYLQDQFKCDYWELIGDQFGAKTDIQGVGKYSAR